MATEHMNLNPQERRLVVGVGLVVFIVLNIWFVWPHFGDWRKIANERDDAERKLARYEKEVAQLPRLQAKLGELEASGPSVVEDERDLNLANLVQIQAQAHKLEIARMEDVRAGSTVTNQFFDEKAVTLTYNAETESLVNFLGSLTDTNSLIRVQELSVRPVPANAPVRLNGQIRLVASYQRKAPVPPPTPPSTNTPPHVAPVANVKSNSVPVAAATVKPSSPKSNSAPAAVSMPKRQLPSTPKP